MNSASWAIDSEPIRARGIIVHYFRDDMSKDSSFFAIFHMSRDTYSTIHLISKRRYLITLLIPRAFSLKKKKTGRRPFSNQEKTMRMRLLFYPLPLIPLVAFL